MTVLELACNDKPLNKVVEDAVDSVSESVRSFSTSFIDRVKKQSLDRASILLANSTRMRIKIEGLIREIYRINEVDKPLVAEFIFDSVGPWVSDFDDILDSWDKLTLLINTASRETRRKHATSFDKLRACVSEVEHMRAISVDLLEYFSPTPEDYLEQELRKAYGDASEDLLKGFKEISSSQSFTMKAFKQRHKLK